MWFQFEDGEEYDPVEDPATVAPRTTFIEQDDDLYEEPVDLNNDHTPSAPSKTYFIDSIYFGCKALAKLVHVFHSFSLKLQ